MTSDVYALQAGPLTQERWAPFGWLPVRDTDPRDGQSRLEFTLDDVHLNVIAHYTGNHAHRRRAGLPDALPACDAHSGDHGPGQ